MLNLIERLRGLDIDARQPDELIELRAGARQLEAEYVQQAYEVPDWLKERGKAIDVELQRQRTDWIAKRLRELDAQDAAGMSETEKRQARQQERERLKAQLTGAAV